MKNDNRQEMRDTLLMLSGKLMVKDDETVKNLLRLYFPDSPKGLEGQEKVELMFKNMEQDWLLKVWIDDKFVLQVKDIATTDNWILECSQLRTERIRKAFGYPIDNPTQENLIAFFKDGKRFDTTQS